MYCLIHSCRIRDYALGRYMSALFSEENTTGGNYWFVMRDLKRFNAKMPAYKFLSEKNFKVFTPMKCRLCVRNGRKIKEMVPVIRDLLFVYSSRQELDPVVTTTPTLQYRYKRGSYCSPMIIPEQEMERFIHAVNTSDQPRYFLPGELTPDMCGRMVHIMGGALDGYEGRLLSIRGARKKRLIVDLPGFFSVGVEVEPEYIELL